MSIINDLQQESSHANYSLHCVQKTSDMPGKNEHSKSCKVGMVVVIEDCGGRVEGSPNLFSLTHHMIVSEDFGTYFEQFKFFLRGF